MKPALHDNLRKHLLNVALAAHKLRLYRTVMQARGHIIASKAREGLGLTQREMAKRLGIDHTYLSRIENDKAPLTVPLAEAILAMVDDNDRRAASGADGGDADSRGKGQNTRCNYRQPRRNYRARSEGDR